MRAPNPILGIHVTPGAIASALVQRDTDGSYRVLSHGVTPAPEDPVEAVAEGARITTRRQHRGRGAFLTLPDAAGSLGPARLPPEEQDLTGEDLHRELHEYTPFEPEAAALRARPTGLDGRRRAFLVAALPAAQERRFRDAALSHGDGFTGLGFSGAAMARGARALGLAASGTFVVEIQPRVTLVYAFDDAGIRRYLVPAGERDVFESAARALDRPAADVRRDALAPEPRPATDSALAAASDDLGADIASVAAYHVAQRYAPKDPPADLPAPAFVAAGPAARYPALLRAVGSRIGIDLSPPSSPRDPAEAIRFEAASAGDPAAVAGAVGAALEAFSSAEERIALVPPPQQMAPGGRTRPAIWYAAAGAAVAAGGLIWFARTVPDADRLPAEAQTADLLRGVEVAEWLGMLGALQSVLAVGSLPAQAVEIEPRAGAYVLTLVAESTDPVVADAALRATEQAGAAWTVRDAAWSEDGTRLRWTVTPEDPTVAPADVAVRRTELRPAVDRWRRRADAVLAERAALRGTDVVVWRTRDALEAVAASLEPIVAARPAAVIATTTDDGVRVEWRRGPRPGAAVHAQPGGSAHGVRAKIDAALRRLADPFPSGALCAPSPAGGARPSRLTPVPAGGPAAIRLTWESASAGHLERLDPGSSAWTRISDVAAGTGEFEDEPPAGPGTYRWRIAHPAGGPPLAEVGAELRPEVSCELLGPAAGGAAVLRLTRNWKGTRYSADVTVRRRAPVTAWAADPRDPATRVSLDTGRVLAAVREDTADEEIPAPLPDFAPDGRVIRSREGLAVRSVRTIRRRIRTLSADLAGPEGTPVLQVSRKMTDG